MPIHVKQSNSFRSLSLLLALGLAAPACAKEEPEPESKGAPQVETEVNPDIDFSTYSSFHVIDPETSTDDQPPTEYEQFKAEIESSIIDELTSKGLVLDPDNPQLSVNPLVSIEHVTDQASFYDAYWGWYYGYQYLWTVPVDYDVGSLLIDVVDRGNPDDVADDVLVYRGVAKGLLGEDTEYIKLQLRNAVNAIFADWPTRTVED